MVYGPHIFGFTHFVHQMLTRGRKLRKFLTMVNGTAYFCFFIWLGDVKLGKVWLDWACLVLIMVNRFKSCRYLVVVSSDVAPFLSWHLFINCLTP